MHFNSYFSVSTFFVVFFSLFFNKYCIFLLFRALLDKKFMLTLTRLPWLNKDFCSNLHYSALLHSYSILFHSIPFHCIVLYSIPFRSVPFPSIPLYTIFREKKKCDPRNKYVGRTKSLGILTNTLSTTSPRVKPKHSRPTHAYYEIKLWGTQEETHTFTIITSLNYLFSITRKDNRHNITTHRAHAQLTVPNYITNHITFIYTSALSLLALTKLIPLNLTVSDTLPHESP